MRLNDIPERGASLNRLELIGVANKDQLASPLPELFGDTGQLACSNHSCFIDHHHIAAGDRLIAAVPARFQRGECSG